MARTRLVIVVAAALALAGCGAGGVEPDPVVVPAADPVGAAAEPDEVARDADGLGGTLTTADAGTGTITVDSVAYDGISGMCDVSKDFGMEPVTDPAEDGVSIVLGVDNVSAGTSSTTNAFNLKVLSPPGFTLEGDPSGSGTFDEMTLLEPWTSLDHVDLAVLSMRGTTDDGRAVHAEIVCILDKP